MVASQDTITLESATGVPYIGECDMKSHIRVSQEIITSECHKKWSHKSHHTN